MWEVRNRVQELLQESAYTYQGLADEIAKRTGQKIWGSEISRFLSGALDTPKARRVLVDCLELLSEEKSRRERLLEKSK
jgi:hypothetical protein